MQWIEPTTPWLACAKRPPAADRLDIFVSDLRRIFSCSCEHDDLQRQLDNAGITSPVGKMLDHFMEHFCRLMAPERQAKFELRHFTPGELGAEFRLEWWAMGALCFTFQCHAASDPAACLRDEVILPLFRANGELCRLLPNDIEWMPPVGPLPLPTMQEPLVSRILEHARDPGAPPSRALASPPNEDVASVAEPTRPTSAHTVEHPPPAVHSSETVDVAGLTELSEAEQRKKRVQEARERKANKTARH